MKGVPLRLELGPRDIEAGVCVAARRDNGEKLTVSLDSLETEVPKLLEAVQQGLFDKAKRTWRTTPTPPRRSRRSRTSSKTAAAAS